MTPAVNITMPMVNNVVKCTIESSDEIKQSKFNQMNRNMKHMIKQITFAGEAAVAEKRKRLSKHHQSQHDKQNTIADRENGLLGDLHHRAIHDE
jgi:hypothetical protein